MAKGKGREAVISVAGCMPSAALKLICSAGTSSPSTATRRTAMSAASKSRFLTSKLLLPSSWAWSVPAV